MKNTLAIITTLLAVQTVDTQAALITLTEHTQARLSFSVTPTRQLGSTFITDTTPDQVFAGVVNISAFEQPGHIIAITVNWMTFGYSVNDSFGVGPGITSFAGFYGESAELLPAVQPVWQWTYVNHSLDPAPPPQVPDAGGVLGMLGCAMIGLWGARRVLA